MTSKQSCEMYHHFMLHQFPFIVLTATEKVKHEVCIARILHRSIRTSHLPAISCHKNTQPMVSQVFKSNIQWSYTENVASKLQYAWNSLALHTQKIKRSKNPQPQLAPSIWVSLEPTNRLGQVCLNSAWVPPFQCLVVLLNVVSGSWPCHQNQIQHLSYCW